MNVWDPFACLTWPRARNCIACATTSDPFISGYFHRTGPSWASASTTESSVSSDVATGKPLRTLQGQNHSPQFLAFSPDGKILASGDSWNKLRLWDVATGRQGGVRDCTARDILPGVFRDGKTLAVADGNAVCLQRRVWARTLSRKPSRHRPLTRQVGSPMARPSPWAQAMRFGCGRPRQARPLGNCGKRPSPCSTRQRFLPSPYL